MINSDSHESQKEGKKNIGQSHLNLNALNTGKVSINAPYAPDVAILDMGKTMTFPKPTPYMLVV